MAIKLAIPKEDQYPQDLWDGCYPTPEEANDEEDKNKQLDKPE